MYKTTVVEHFGNKNKVAAALDISHVAVNKWPELIPIGRAYEIQVLTNNKLKVNRSLYHDQPKQQHRKTINAFI